MFCNSCGAELKPGQQFCGSCGRAAFATVTQSSATGRVERHVQMLAILWLVYSGLHVIAGIAILLVANTVLATLGVRGVPGAPMPPGGVPGFVQPLVSFVGGIVVMKGILGVGAGWGLLQREHWARLIALVVAFVSLIDMPFGTALAIYTIWALMSTDAEKEYAALAAR